MNCKKARQLGDVRRRPTPQSPPRPENLRTEGRSDDPTVDVVHPRLTWQSALSRREDGEAQVRLSREVSTGRGNSRLVWSATLSGPGADGAVVYPGPSLEPDTRFSWTCRERTAGQDWGPWALSATFATGLLGRWTAPFIGAPADLLMHRGAQHVYYYCNQFDLDEMASDARLYATALGVYQVRINGHTVPLGEQAPGWTSYEHRLHYQTANVTEHLKPGRNAVVVAVGPGWWAGTIAWFGRHIYGEATSISLDLRITGSTSYTRMTTGPDGWNVVDGPVIESDLVMGERQDLRVPQPPHNPLASQRPAEVVPPPEVVFEAQPHPPMAVQQTLTPVQIVKLAPDTIIADFGQHLSGRVTLTAGGPAGSIVRMRHAEALTTDGLLYTANLRTTQQLDCYILSGKPDDVMRPLFAQHGFRYVEISGPVSISPGRLVAEIIHSTMPQSGWFRTSNATVNRIQQNVTWSQRSNFLGIPVDCAQRDERLGWTGDINLFAPTAMMNFDCAPLLESWLTSLTDDQRPDGAVRDIAPYPHLSPPPRDIQTGQPGWGDAILGLPWEIYVQSGDVRVLQRCWPAAADWLDYVHRIDPRSSIRQAGTYGDWNALERTPGEVIGTSWYARSLKTAIDVANTLGEHDSVSKYRDRLQRARSDFVEAFVDDAGRVHGDTQTSYTVALANNLIPAGRRQQAVRHLVSNIDKHAFHLTTGFVGTAWILTVLTDHGEASTAYRLLAQDTYPSWGNQINLGATAMWEHWNTWQPPNNFQNPAMNSFNHFALATVGQFLMQRVAGINPDKVLPGYGHVHFRPHPTATLGTVNASLRTSHGLVKSSWRVHDTSAELTIAAPRASTLHLPGHMIFAPGEVSHDHSRAIRSPTVALPPGVHKLRLIEEVP